jgi:hypothetical protein
MLCADVQYVAEHASTADDALTALQQGLSSSDCYCASFRFPAQSGKTFIVFLLWAPEDATVHDKMVTAGHKEQLKRQLNVDVEIQACELSELAKSEINDKIYRHMYIMNNDFNLYAE